MQHLSDAQLLLRYGQQGSEAAFAEIVARHADIVYSAALRQVDLPDLARDVAQTVFIDLARKARSLADKLSPDASLVGWLYRSTRFAALNVVRGNRRRQAIERQAMDHLENVNQAEAPLDWDRIRPLLDEAISTLGDEDRDALLLRFFKNQDFRAVGLALGVSDEAAQKRVSRALGRLHDLLAHRGITTTAAALSAAISANTVQTAPAGLVAILSSAAVTAMPIPSTAIAAAKILTMTAIQKTIIGAALVAAIGTAVLLHPRTEPSVPTPDPTSPPANHPEDAEERTAGYSEADAKLIAAVGVALPQLHELKQLSSSILDLANSYRQAGDSASQQAVLQMALQMGQQLDPSGPGGQFLIDNVTGIAIQLDALKAMDPASAYDSSVQTVQNYIDQITQQRATFRQLITQTENYLCEQKPPEDQIGFLDRAKFQGELAAIQWYLAKTVQPSASGHN